MATAKTIEQLNEATQINATDQMALVQESGIEAVRGSVQMLAGAVAEINETGALSELVYATSQGKNLLAQNLTAKGVPTQAEETLIQMADKVAGLAIDQSAENKYGEFTQEDLSAEQYSTGTTAFAATDDSKVVALVTGSVLYVYLTESYDGGILNKEYLMAHAAASCPLKNALTSQIKIFISPKCGIVGVYDASYAGIDLYKYSAEEQTLIYWRTVLKSTVSSWPAPNQEGRPIINEQGTMLAYYVYGSALKVLWLDPDTLDGSADVLSTVSKNVQGYGYTGAIKDDCILLYIGRKGTVQGYSYVVKIPYTLDQQSHTVAAPGDNWQIWKVPDAVFGLTVYYLGEENKDLFLCFEEKSATTSYQYDGTYAFNVYVVDPHTATSAQTELKTFGLNVTGARFSRQITLPISIYLLSRVQTQDEITECTVGGFNTVLRYDGQTKTLTATKEWVANLGLLNSQTAYTPTLGDDVFKCAQLAVLGAKEEDKHIIFGLLLINSTYASSQNNSGSFGLLCLKVRKGQMIAFARQINGQEAVYLPGTITAGNVAQGKYDKETIITPATEA